MEGSTKAINWKYTLPRVLLFCVLCALVLILGSSLLNGISKPMGDIILGTIAAIAVFALTIPFARWEGLSLRALGIIPHKYTLPKALAGFLLGLLIAALHVGMVLIFGRVRLEPVEAVPYTALITTLLLYLVLAAREELAFRGYPLRSLAYALGPWKAQLIIAMIFAFEHAAGGYTWAQAFLGAGVGAVLFGLAALKTNGIAFPIGLHAA